jgi:ABC-2 type transport system permease protein
MTGAIFKETLRRTWLQMFIWGVGFGLMGLLIIAMVPDATGLQAMMDLLDDFPPFLLRMAGVGDDLAYVGTPEGYIMVGFFGKVLLFFAVYPVLMGLRVTVNEENDGTMDMLLSLPVPRWQIIVEKFVAYFLSVIGVIAIFYVGLVIGNEISGIGLDMAAIGEASINIIPAMTFILALTTLIGAFIGDRRKAVIFAGSFVFASFMLDTAGATFKDSFLEALSFFSFFHYYDSIEVASNGTVWLNVIGLLIFSIGMIAAALWAFDRRDIAS